jgi:hypothetical protein
LTVLLSKSTQNIIVTSRNAEHRKLFNLSQVNFKNWRKNDRNLHMDRIVSFDSNWDWNFYSDSTSGKDKDWKS